MRRSYFFAIVIIGGILAIGTVLFFIVGNPYERLNPEPQPEVIEPTLDDQLPPLASEAEDTELVTVWGGPTLGMTTGVDGQRLVFYDTGTNAISVTEFDGTGLQDLSDTLLGVEAMQVAPTKDKAWLNLTDPETGQSVTLVYDFRVQEAVRLEDGIIAIDWSPDGTELVYYVDREGIAPALKVVGDNGIEPRTIRSGLVIQNPILDWYDQTRLAYWLAPSSTRPSAIITMNITGDSAVELSEPGLAAQAVFSPDGTYALIGRNDPVTGKPQLLLGTPSDRQIQELPISTWVQKCTWMDDSARVLCFVPRDLPGGFTYPEDDTGEHAYRDQLWMIDAATAQPQLLYDVPSSILSASRPFASQNGTRLNFAVEPGDSVVSLDISDKVVSPSTPTDATETNTGDESSDGADTVN